MTSDEYVSICECGHTRDEHGGVLGTACQVEGCDCIMFDWAPEASEDE